MRATGTYVTATTLGEPVRAFVPRPLPPARPALAPESYEAGTRDAELALARLSGVSGLVPSVEWLLYSAIRKEALLTSQIEGTQATLTDLFDGEAGLVVANINLMDAQLVDNFYLFVLSRYPAAAEKDTAEAAAVGQSQAAGRRSAVVAL